MSCHPASTASATTASSPVKPAPTISSVSVSCLPCRSFRSMPSRRPAPRLRRALSPRSQKHQSIHALAAAATCASSRPSCAVNSRNTNPRQFRQRSGSTPHDDGTDARHMQIRSMSVLASSRQRYPLRLHVNVAVRQNSKAQNCVTKTIRDPFTIQFTHMLRGQNCPRCRHVPPHRRLSPRRNPHSCGTAYVPPPRFRALALFGRRPPERVVGIVGAGVRKPAQKQLKVMSAIENCRTAELGGHVARCENEKCGHTQIAYNSCRNRHCPKCQGAAAREWLAGAQGGLLPG